MRKQDEMTIPVSRWVLEKNYFNVYLVDNFRSKFIEWSCFEHDGYSLFEDKKALDLFLDTVGNCKEISVYQFPDSEDYFEETDDNFVIPRHLFKLKGEK